jgi:hypothetical protein
VRVLAFRRRKKRMPTIHHEQLRGEPHSRHSRRRSTGPALGRPKSFPPTSVQGVQASPVRPAHLCPHIMQNQKDKLPLFSLGHIHVTNGAQAELTARAFTPATLLERHVSATGQTCRRPTVRRTAPLSGTAVASFRRTVSRQLSAFGSSPRPPREHDDSAT